MRYGSYAAPLATRVAVWVWSNPTEWRERGNTGTWQRETSGIVASDGLQIGRAAPLIRTEQTRQTPDSLDPSEDRSPRARDDVPILSH